jgi:uncharacterized protein
MIVVDTGVLVALIDRNETHHDSVRALLDSPDAEPWVIPWAVLPEVDYLVARHLGGRAYQLWLDDLADGLYDVHWGTDVDLDRARAILKKHKALNLGLVDAVVMATAEHLGASAIATLDLRHFGAVKLRGSPRLLPRDL